MNWFKEFIVKLFGIKTYEREYTEYKSMYEDLQKTHNISLAVIETYKKDLEDLTLINEDPLEYIHKQIDDTVSAYEECVNDLEEMTKKQEQLEHRAFANGRQAAYSEMGIWRLNALKAGNCLVCDEEGNVFELLQNLEDVKAEDYDNEPTISLDEISLDGIEGVKEA